MFKKLLPILTFIAIAALIFPHPAAAAGLNDGRVILGDEFVLKSGEVLDGDLIVLGGDVELEEGSIVEGDVFVLGGDVTAAGRIDGDVAVLGGQISLEATAIVRGDISSLGGNLDRDPAAQVNGQVFSGQGVDVPFDFDFGFGAGEFVRPSVDMWRVRLSPLISLLWFGFRTVLLAALAVLVVMFWPTPAGRAAEAVVAQPVAAGGLGVITLVVAPALLLLLTITIILSPVALIGVVLLVVAGVFGWIALGLEVGNRMKTAFNWELHPAAAAGIGTLVLTFVLGGIGQIPCIGWIAPFLGISLGLGAVLLTRFGSQPYAPMSAPDAEAV